MGVIKNKAAKAAKTKAKTPKVTHRSLDHKFEALGIELVLRVGPIHQMDELNTPEGFKSDRLARLVQAAKDGTVKKSLSSKTFGKFYRTRLDAHDELISTSSVRELLRGMVSEAQKKVFPGAKMDVLDRLLNNVSKVRLPTKYSGFASKAAVMQHPTSEGEGVFGDPKKTAKQHSAFDLSRKAAIETAMREAVAAKENAGGIVQAGLRTAIAYTLNDFTAPVTASDVHPFSAMSRKSVSSATLLGQVRARERMKEIFVSLGGKQESGAGGGGGTDYRRGWAHRQGRGLRSVSPPRKFPGKGK